MRVTLRSDDSPDVVLEHGAEVCGIQKLDQHIRTLQTARRWLVRERRLKTEREKKAASKAPK